jgi:RNA polymerase sigma-70 factor, ECF subfamily
MDNATLTVCGRMPAMKAVDGIDRHVGRPAGPVNLTEVADTEVTGEWPTMGSAVEGAVWPSRRARLRREGSAMTAAPDDLSVQFFPGPALCVGQVHGSGAATADEDAMGELWQAHGPSLLRFALKLTLGDRPQAEDIVQETLLRAWRHPEVVGSGRTPIRGWLFTVTRHIAIDMWRARSRAVALEEVIDDIDIELPDPVEVIERTVDAIDVQAALDLLSPAHRQVITEMYFRGHSVTETAEILGIPMGTVKSRSYHALRILRQIAPR